MSNEIVHPNWFVETDAIKTFSDNLLQYAGQKIDFLQIGAFTGDASLWLLENILTHPQSTLTDVDIWKGDPGLEGFDWETAYVEYKRKTSSYPGKLHSFQMMSDQFFKQNVKEYDMIYIDGDHGARAVLRDAVNAFDCLKEGGLLIFDDYEFAYHALPAANCPKTAIDAFMNIHWFDFKKISEGRQMWLKKIDRAENKEIFNWQ